MFWLGIGLIGSRIRFLRRISPSRTLSIPVHSIRMDSYGIIFDCGPSTFHYEQCLRGHDLVLLAGLLGHLQ